MQTHLRMVGGRGKEQMTPVDLGKYAIEYQEAVNVLLDDKTWKREFTLFPSIYLFRHYIELRLKEIILTNWEFLGWAKPFPRGHNIYKLWNVCRDCMKETDKLVDPGFARSKRYIEQIIGVYDALETDLNRFAEIDPDSERSRYPVDSQGNPIVVDNKVLGKLRRELPELVKRISYNLDGISTGIHTILRDKYAGLAQQEHSNSII